jgi:hypothetical protein
VSCVVSGFKQWAHSKFVIRTRSYIFNFLTNKKKSFPSPSNQGLPAKLGPDNSRPQSRDHFDNTRIIFSYYFVL